MRKTLIDDYVMAHKEIGLSYEGIKKSVCLCGILHNIFMHWNATLYNFVHIENLEGKIILLLLVFDKKT